MRVYLLFSRPSVDATGAGIAMIVLKNCLDKASMLAIVKKKTGKEQSQMNENWERSRYRQSADTEMIVKVTMEEDESKCGRRCWTVTTWQRCNQGTNGRKGSLW